MSKKLTFKFVKQYFEDRDCELLETEYKNNSTKMRYKCKCEEVDKICFSGFKKRTKCIGHSNNTKKLTLDYVKQYFEDRDCELFEMEYINSHTLMRYRCKCGNKECKISFNNFKKGQRCAKCYGNEKLTLKEVKEYFKDNDCELLETEYKNNRTKMEYECKCGNKKCKITFKRFKIGQRCSECRGGVKFTYKYVKQYFEDHDCKLLATEYVDANTPMKYKCKCGNSDCKISFSHFKNGERCKKCAIKRNSGKNHPNYNSNLTDEEREKNRSRPGCNKWRKLIIKRDDNTSQCCFQEGGKLIAHHIENYANNKELGTVLSNGFLFCNKHHKKFHNKYGYDCNREQLEEFLERHQKDIIISIINEIIKKKNN